MKRTNDIDSIKSELEQEKKYRDSMVNSNRELEANIHRMEKELQRLKKEDPSSIQVLNSSHSTVTQEGFQAFQAQLNANMKLEKDIALERERLRILTDSETDITELNLDGLTQAELIRVVKQLERMKTDLQSSLRDTEHNLDSQAREYFRLNETRRLYQAELDLRQKSKGGRKFPRSSESMTQLSSS
ncbi:myosin-3-like isoform X2 [Nilaparvata lugens]|uniref:myosin-3-like isoform X1 n=1 Tax=Nilaparvata lugens TaxID=108931 RepID=UPI00193E6FA7|nr:myosin-3-like isoform X1 [Nilaparvata lugens]XP_039300102.1 myosin-3-like isoform X2 [Nilaparvata lugens]